MPHLTNAPKLTGTGPTVAALLLGTVAVVAVATAVGNHRDRSGPAVAVVAVATAVGNHRDRSGPAGAGTTTLAACMPDEVATEPGEISFTVTNASDARLDVTLTNADQVVTYGRVDGLTPAASRVLQVRLPPGTYVWNCRTIDGTRTTSDSWTVGAADDDAGRYRPVSPTELDDAVSSYRQVVDAGLTDLDRAVDDLGAEAAAEDLGAARAAWLTAHLDYERLGAAYGTFGDLDARINGRPDGLPGGVHDPGFTGFRLIEHQLWSTDAVGWDDVRAATDRLRADVDDLAADFPVLFTDPADLPLRAHEILENSLQFELNGRSDQGSRTELATVRANVDGTQTVLTALTPVLGARDPELLATTTTGLGALAAGLDGFRSPDGTWAPLDALSSGERRQLNAMVSQLVEELAAVPGLLSLPTASS